MRRFLQVTLIGFAISMLVLALTRAPDANASVAYVSPYTFDQTFGTSLRLLRVYNDFKIREKDKETGYVLFEYRSPESGDKTFQGSLSLVETKSGVHVSAQIPKMPQYHERMIIDQLEKKLVSEHGDPPPRKDKESKDKESTDKESKDKESKDKESKDKDAQSKSESADSAP